MAGFFGSYKLAIVGFEGYCAVLHPHQFVEAILGPKVAKNAK